MGSLHNKMDVCILEFNDLHLDMVMRSIVMTKITTKHGIFCCPISS